MASFTLGGPVRNYQYISIRALPYPRVLLDLTLDLGKYPIADDVVSEQRLRWSFLHNKMDQSKSTVSFDVLTAKEARLSYFR